MPCSPTPDTCGFTLCLTFYCVAAYAFITGSPFVYITYFGVDPQHYGWLFAVNIVGLMAVSMVSRRLVHRYPLEALLRNAVFIAAIAALVLAVTTGLGVRWNYRDCRRCVRVLLYEWHHRGDIHGLRSGRSA